MTQTPEQIAALLDRAECLIGSSYSICYQSDSEARLANLEEAVEDLLLVVRTILENRNDD